MRKTLKELNLLDDFLFGTLLTYPELGEKFSRALLQTIFQREFGKLTVIPQKIYYGSDTDQHGARLDVYMEEENAARVSSVYDVKPDQPHGRLNKETAPRRLRLYHALIDSQCLKSGESYLALKNVIVIMITSYDLFGRDRMVYTIQGAAGISSLYRRDHLGECSEPLINMGREEERARTEQERLRADQEHLRAEQAEEKVRQLEALLKEKN